MRHSSNTSQSYYATAVWKLRDRADNDDDMDNDGKSKTQLTLNTRDACKH